MIARENKQILDYIIGGATHDQIRKWVALSERNYWKVQSFKESSEFQRLKAKNHEEVVKAFKELDTFTADAADMKEQKQKQNRKEV